MPAQGYLASRIVNCPACGAHARTDERSLLCVACSSADCRATPGAYCRPSDRAARSHTDHLARSLVNFSIF